MGLGIISVSVKSMELKLILQQKKMECASNTKNMFMEEKHLVIWHLF